MSAYDAVKARYGCKEISIATWRDPRQSIHPARGGPVVPYSVSTEGAARPVIPYRVKYRPRPPPEPTDDEESEEDDEPEPSVEAQEPPEAPAVPEVNTLDDEAAPDTKDSPPEIVETADPGPATDSAPSEHDAEASTEAEPAEEPPATDSSKQEDVPPTLNEPSAADKSSPTEEVHSTPPEPPELSHEDKLEGDADAEAKDAIDDSVPPAVEALTQESTGGEDELIAKNKAPEEVGQSAPEASVTEVPPEAPEPPSKADATALIEEAAEKKVQFAPGTPEPKPTQRKKKNGKTSKSKKSRRHLPTSDGQGSPDDIVAIVEGPFDEPVLPPPELADVAPAAPDEGKEIEEVNAVSVPEEDAREEPEAVEPPREPVPDEYVEVPALPERVEAEPVRSERSSKKRGKEKSKKKSSKGKAKVVEAPPAVAGLGIDFGGDVSESGIADLKPEAVAEEDRSPVLEEAVGPQDVPTADLLASAENLQDAHNAQPEMGTTEAAAESNRAESVADPASQPSADAEEAAVPQEEPESLEPAESAKEVADESNDQDSRSQDEAVVETSEPSEAEAAPTPETLAVNDDSNNSPEATVIHDDSETSMPTQASDAEAKEDPVTESVTDLEVVALVSNDGEDLVVSQADSSSLSDDQDSSSTPDSAIDLDEGSVSSEVVDTQTEPEIETDKVTEADNVVKEDEHHEPEVDPPNDAAVAAVVPERLDDIAPPLVEEAIVVDESRAESPDDLPVAADATEHAEETLLTDDTPGTEATTLNHSEPVPLDETTEEVVDAVAPERAPSIEQLSNATDVGDDTDSDDGEDASSPSLEDHEANSIAEATNESASEVLAADESTHVDEHTMPAVQGWSAVEDPVEPTPVVSQGAPQPEDDGASDPPEDTTVNSTPAEPSATESVEEADGKLPKDAADDIEPADSEVAVPQEEGSFENLAAVQDESKDPPLSSEAVAPDTAKDNPEVPEAQDVQEVQLSADPAGEEAVNEKTPLLKVVEPAPEPIQEPEIVSATPEDVEIVQDEAVPEPDPPADLPEEKAALPPSPPPGPIEEQTSPCTEEPAEPVVPIIVPVPDPSPSPKLSRSSGSKSKGERYQTRASTKRSKESEKSRHKKSSKDRRERTPEEIEERQRRKDARRLAESSRLLEEERRRFEEEEMRRIRHEVRRAARKAAAAEIERLAREEAEAIARREAEKRRRRRENDVRPRERRDSDVRPRERRESKSSGGFFGMGGGKSETKAGVFVRTDSGGSSRAKDSRDGDGGRSRRVSPPHEDLIEDVLPKEGDPQDTSHEGSSRRRRRHRTESDRAEPRRRNTGERRDEERRDGERKRSSKPAKSKGFFGSLFAKF